MILYHGSTIEVRMPVILPDLRALDFGAGFYCTSSRSQAIQWARIVALRRGSEKAILNTYALNEESIDTLKVLRFKSAAADWLDFVVANRKAQIRDDVYDLVIGPVADDATLPVINDYIDGVYTKEEAVRRLLPQTLTDQYAFLTYEALAVLMFEGGTRL